MSTADSFDSPDGRTYSEPVSGEAPGQAARDLDAAFADGARVRTGPCPAEGHDGDHFQVRTNVHWLCGHLLASLLAVQGIAVAQDRGTAGAPVLHQLSGLVAGWRQAFRAIEEGPFSEAAGAKADTLREVTRQVLAVIGSATAAPAGERPAPELGALARVRELTSGILAVAENLEQSAAKTAPSAKSRAETAAAKMIRGLLDVE